MIKERSVIHKVNQECYARVFKALMSEPHTANDLAELSGLSPLTTRDLLRVLKKHKVVHISAWEQDSRGRDMIAVFSLGAGRDKARYKMPRSEIAKRYRAKRKALEEQTTLNNLLAGGTHAVLRDTPTASTV